MMTEWLVFGLLILGALFVFISAIGLLRLQDVFMRMHATTKTTSLGLVLILIGSIMALPELANVIKGFLVVVFIFLTVPLGTHMISKAHHISHPEKPNYDVKDGQSKED